MGSHERRPLDLPDAIAELDQTLAALVEVIAGDRDVVEKGLPMRVARFSGVQANGGRADELPARRTSFRPMSNDWRREIRPVAHAH